MRAEQFKLVNLTTGMECFDAIENIEADRRNYACSDSDWSRGLQTDLKVSAQNKIGSITRKLNNFPDECGA